jgi:hypothetical protein
MTFVSRGTAYWLSLSDLLVRQPGVSRSSKARDTQTLASLESLYHGRCPVAYTARQGAAARETTTPAVRRMGGSRHSAL